MKIDIEYKDLLLIRGLLEERNVVYRDQIVNGYTDNVTPLDTLQQLEEKQKRIVYILDKLGDKL
jgi:hypothetical protein